MVFRKDINGLRALAVIGVVLYHFDSSLISGGFAGVDVFFVISGFLMTGIILGKVENRCFSIMSFYRDRAKRIIPALAFLCGVLLVFGFVFLSPLELSSLSKHAFAALGFVSNVVFWTESGYFDSTSHEKWLLHTWSLSVEWQFYLLYPIFLVVVDKLFKTKIHFFLVFAFLISFLISFVLTTSKPEFSYFMLPTRAWEMILGGLAFVFCFDMKECFKKVGSYFGVFLIVFSYFYFDEKDYWPGYNALLPALGAYLIIVLNEKNYLFDNLLSQRLGSWSYSIYLWHWPVVVYFYPYGKSWILLIVGFSLSIVLGFLSFKFIERGDLLSLFSRFRSRFSTFFLVFSLLVFVFAGVTFWNNGFIRFSNPDYQRVAYQLDSSPYREKCHISKYKDPDLSCSYFGDDIAWAVLGDSHSVELSYSLAEILKPRGEGVKQYTFSGCKPSYGEPDVFTACAKWYNESIIKILNDDNIKNVVVNHRFTSAVFGGDASEYPSFNDEYDNQKSLQIIRSFDDLIIELSKHKENVFVFYPVPELPRDISKLIGAALVEEGNLSFVIGTTLDWYEKRNRKIIEHFDTVEYPANVKLLNPRSEFCDSKYCYAVKDGVALYFDDDHPSVNGASILADMIVSNVIRH